MAVDEELIERAKKLRVGAVNSVLQSEIGGVYRLSYALAGSWGTGRAMARFVLNRSVKMMPKWDPGDDPADWYHRFTILTARRLAKPPPATKSDVLVEQSLSPDRQYIAFIAALRHLEYQQREAFLLRHGEKLNGRYSALAMDCSTSAAENHLRAAEQTLKLVAGEDFDCAAAKVDRCVLPPHARARPSATNGQSRRVAAGARATMDSLGMGARPTGGAGGDCLGWLEGVPNDSDMIG